MIGPHDLERLLRGDGGPPALHGVADVRCETVLMPVRDGIGLATDLYLPSRLPAPALAMRTPYGRASDKIVGALMTFAQLVLSGALT